jgi:hypothetical protein
MAEAAKTSHQMVEDFLSQCLRKLRYRRAVKENQAARKIQENFRARLIRLEFHRSYENMCAIKIQRAYRKFRQDIRGNEARRAVFLYSLNKLRQSKGIKGPVYTAPKASDKPKVIIELPPPWRTPQRLKRLSTSQVNAMLTAQMADMKWINQLLIPQFVKRIFSQIDCRERVRGKNEAYRNRQVPRNFFTMVYRTINKLPEKCGRQLILHWPTFRAFVVHQRHITIQFANCGPDDIEIYEAPGGIIDSAMDKRSGRLFCLLRDWSISVFENGFFAIPTHVSTPRPILPQPKYLYCDKLGRCWIVLTQQFGSVYLLDSLCFTMIRKIKFNLPKSAGRVRSIIPLFQKGILTGFLAVGSNNGDLLVTS